MSQKVHIDKTTHDIHEAVSQATEKVGGIVFTVRTLPLLLLSQPVFPLSNRTYAGG